MKKTIRKVRRIALACSMAAGCLLHVACGAQEGGDSTAEAAQTHMNNVALEANVSAAGAVENEACVGTLSNGEVDNFDVVRTEHPLPGVPSFEHVSLESPVCVVEGREAIEFLCPPGETLENYGCSDGSSPIEHPYVAPSTATLSWSWNGAQVLSHALLHIATPCRPYYRDEVVSFEVTAFGSSGQLDTKVVRFELDTALPLHEEPELESLVMELDLGSQSTERLELQLTTDAVCDQVDARASVNAAQVVVQEVELLTPAVFLPLVHGR